MDFNTTEMLGKVGLFFVPFLFALCFHEFAHGWMAKRKGDNTAELMGRLTLNPVAHADIIGTVLLPLAAIMFGWPFFGWAKPVPVNERNLDHPREDMFWIALAGPASNILLAVVGAILFVVVNIVMAPSSTQSALTQMLNVFVLINLFLALFNMIPLHPLDGGKVLARFLSPQLNDQLERHQSTLSFILIGVFLLGGFRYFAIPVFWLHKHLMGTIVSLV